MSCCRTWTWPAQAPSVRASKRAASRLLATGALIPRHDVDAVGRARRPDRRLEVDVVERADVAGDKAHVLGGDLSLGVERLYQEAGDAVAGLGSIRDHVAHD